MGEFLAIHPVNPQERLIHQVVDVLHQGGVVVYPTDSSYALGCCLGNKEGLRRIRQIRQLHDKHQFTLICRDLSEISVYARVDNSTYRLLKRLTPGAYTFLLLATREVPRRLQHPKRKSIGIRVPDCPITQMLLETLGEPLITTTLMLPGDEFPLTDPDEMFDQVGAQVEMVIDGGFGGMELTTVLSFVEDEPIVVRQGKGKI